MTPGLRGFYEGTDGKNVIRLPRNVDPAQDGTRFAAHHQPIFDISDAPDSVPLAEFDRRVAALVPTEVLARIEHVIEAGKFLALKGLADAPPLDENEWRRGMILSWSHARDLVVAHDAIGHPRNLANRHDVDEVVLARHLKGRLSRADQWYKDYVLNLDDGAWVNVGFFNPHISASLYKWGDAMSGMQNGMDAHRLSAHHLGSPEAPIDWIERAVNFTVHHIPREHHGIRHEPRGNYADLERLMATDDAMKNSEIGKAIARDAASLYEMLEKEGKVVPWHLLQVPQETLTPSVVEHAFLITRVAAPRLATLDIQEESHRLARAQAIMAQLPHALAEAKQQGRADLVAAYERFQTNA